MSADRQESIPELICELCRQFYDLGWVSGTGGGISIRGAEGITGRQRMTLALARVSSADVRELVALELGALDLDDVIRLAIHDVTPDYVRELRELGYDSIPAEQLVAMRVHDVTPAFIRELRAAGFRDLPAETLVRMKIHGVGPEIARGRSTP